MTLASGLLLAAFLAVLLATVQPLGLYIHRMLAGEGRLPWGLARFERGLFRLLGIDSRREMEWKEYALALLSFNLLTVVLAAGKAGILNPGAHGFSEVLYAFTSAANNNGSAFAGLSANTPYYNSMLATALWFGRFGALVPYLAIAGSLAKKHRLEPGEGTLPTDGVLFVILLMATVLIVGALTYFPALALGPFAEHFLAEAALLSSLADETPEGRSIVLLAQQRFGSRDSLGKADADDIVPFTARTRMSGVDIHGRRLRKGAVDAVRKFIEAQGRPFPASIVQVAEDVAQRGSTPLVVADGPTALGVVELKDVVKGGIKERFAELRRMGIRTTMITGDNHLTAAAIAAEAGVDDFLSEATPEAKLELIRKHRAQGKIVAMSGDGTNDAPALAQADVAVAMNSGTQAAKEAGNMVDLGSNPTKLIEIVEIGKQMLMTRGALTTFSIANDVAKYFAIIPAAFAPTYPQLGALNVMGLATPASAILSAVIFNALIIVALIPLALKGVPYRPLGATGLLRRNLLIYGLGGVVAPFLAIKLIDRALALIGAA